MTNFGKIVQVAGEHRILMLFALLNQLTASGIRDVGALARRLGISQIALKIRLGIPVAA